MSYTDAYISATRGTKENPYSSFSEAMKDGREGQNVYVGKTGEKPTYTKMAYADSSKPSKKKDSASTFFDDNASGIVRDVATALMFPPSIPFTLGKYLFGGQDREGNKRSGIFNLDRDGDGSPYTSTKDGKVTNIFGQELNMDKDRKISGFFDSLDVDGDGSFLTTGGSFFSPMTDEQKADFQKKALESTGGDSSPTASALDPNAVGVLPDGTLKCKEGFFYDIKTKMCVKMEEETPTVKAEPVGIQTLDNPFTYGQTTGEAILSPAVGAFQARDGMAVQNLRRQPSGIVTGPGGPKDDLVGPIALSAQEFVMPKEQIMMKGNGDYNKGIRQLEAERKKSLKQYDVA